MKGGKVTRRGRPANAAPYSSCAWRGGAPECLQVAEAAIVRRPRHGVWRIRDWGEAQFRSSGTALVANSTAPVWLSTTTAA